jgi:hypothetical protein
MGFWHVSGVAILNVTGVDTGGLEWTGVDIFLLEKGLTEFGNPKHQTPITREAPAEEDHG